MVKCFYNDTVRCIFPFTAILLIWKISYHAQETWLSANRLMCQIHCPPPLPRINTFWGHEAEIIWGLTWKCENLEMSYKSIYCENNILCELNEILSHKLSKRKCLFHALDKLLLITYIWYEDNVINPLDRGNEEIFL